MKKNNNNICRMTLLALPLLMLSACSQDDTITVGQTITLTTPVIELSGVQASSRAAQGQNLVDVANFANISLYLHDSEARKYNLSRSGTYDGFFDNSISWNVYRTVTVTGGEGDYRAGIRATINLNATDAMSAIVGGMYAYRGSIKVEANGTFIPNGSLQPYTSAVLLKLKDADGAVIGPKPSMPELYLIKPIGFAVTERFIEDSDGQTFPNGKDDPVFSASTLSFYELVSHAYGNYTPGTYPATWTEGGQLVTSATPTAPWPLFEVTYCKDGFNGGIPNSSATTWTVNYPAKQLTLERGKLYTFTATLGANANITLDAENAVTVSKWEDGSTIHVGR